MTSTAFDDQFLPHPDDVAQASAEGAGGDWRIDHSAGRPILVYQNCSVIEAEQAEYVLRLIEADRQQRGGDVRPTLRSLHRELALIESDPDSDLSDGARRTLKWARRSIDAALAATKGERNG